MVLVLGPAFEGYFSDITRIAFQRCSGSVYLLRPIVFKYFVAFKAKRGSSGPSLA